MSLSDGETGGALESSSHPAPMSQSGKRFERLAAFGVSHSIVSLLAVDVGEIGEGAGDPPGVPSFAEYFERGLIQNSGGQNIALRASDVALLVGGPGGATLIAKFQKNVGSFVQSPSGASIVSTNFDYVRQIVQAAGHGQPIGQQTPAGEATLEVALS